jgi:hypothetical protein
MSFDEFQLALGRAAAPPAGLRLPLEALWRAVLAE